MEVDHVHRNPDQRRFFARRMEQRPFHWPEAPLRPKEVWAIRVRLQMKRRKRNLAMFNLAIDSKLRGCDFVSLRIDDIASGDRVRDRSTIVPHKTGRPVRV